jgi:hypothetical protein
MTHQVNLKGISPKWRDALFFITAPNGATKGDRSWKIMAEIAEMGLNY